MGFFDIKTNSVRLTPCSESCVCKELLGHMNECEVQFAGFSKDHNKGVMYNKKFYMERLAESWNGNIHDYGVTIKRDQVVKTGMILEKLLHINHPNIMPILSYCDCTVVAEYIPGVLLNAKKETWLLGPRAGEKDYADTCSIENMLRVFLQVGDGLAYLHQHQICHTDPIDHNIIVTNDGTAKLIDLICAMPLNEDLLTLDRYIFLNRLVVPMSNRLGLHLTEDIKRKATFHGTFDLRSLLYDLNNMF